MSGNLELLIGYVITTLCTKMSVTGGLIHTRLWLVCKVCRKMLTSVWDYMLAWHFTRSANVQSWEALSLPLSLSLSLHLSRNVFNYLHIPLTHLSVYKLQTNYFWMQFLVAKSTKDSISAMPYQPFMDFPVISVKVMLSDNPKFSQMSNATLGI